MRIDPRGHVESGEGMIKLQVSSCKKGPTPARGPGQLLFYILVIITQRSYPDIAVLYRVPMVLQSERSCGRVFRIKSDPPVKGLSKKCLPVVQDYPVMDDSNVSRYRHLPILKFRSFKNDVIGLPLSRFS